MERLKMAIDDLLIKLAKTFTKPKLQTVFLINNYDMTIAVLKVHWLLHRNLLNNPGALDCSNSNCAFIDVLGILCFSFQEAGPEGGKIQVHFEELLRNNTAVYVVSC